MGNLERSQHLIREVAEQLSNVPELQYVIEMLNTTYANELGEAPMHYIVRTYIHYLRIIKQLASLSPNDLAVITQVNQSALSKSEKTVSRGGAEVFVQTLGPQRLQTLLRNITLASDVTSPTFKNAIQDLAKRMVAGHELVASGEKIGDGASADADFAIWGHTTELQTEAMFHLVIAHFLNRMCTQMFANDSDKKLKDLISHKDCLVTALGDVIYLLNAKDKAVPEMVGIWRRPKTQGGLRWNKEEKQVAYDEVVGYKERSPMHQYNFMIPSVLQGDFRRLVKEYLWETHVVASKSKEAQGEVVDDKGKLRNRFVDMEMQHPTDDDSMRRHTKFQIDWFKIVHAYQAS